MPTVCFDVDGTLIHQSGERENAPRYEVIDLYRSLERLGFQMFIWSGGGIDYAAHWRDKLGLFDAIVVAKGSFQPDIAVDDMAHSSEFNLGKVNIPV